MSTTYYVGLTRTHILNELERAGLDDYDLKALRALIVNESINSWFEGICTLLISYNREYFQKNYSVDWNEYNFYHNVINAIDGSWEFEHFDIDIDNFYVKLTSLLDSIIMSMSIVDVNNKIQQVPVIYNHVLKGDVCLCLILLK